MGYLAVINFPEGSGVRHWVSYLIKLTDSYYFFKVMEAFKLIISSMSNLAHPRHRTDSWSSQHTENEMISTNRDHTKVGQPAVYIVPKEL